MHPLLIPSHLPFRITFGGNGMGWEENMRENVEKWSGGKVRKKKKKEKDEGEMG